MFIAYVVMIQNDEYTTPQVCFDFGGDSSAQYETIQDAEQFIDWMVEEGYHREDYFIAKIERI